MSKKFSLNNIEISSNNNDKKEKKYKSRYEFKYKNNINNNINAQEEIKETKNKKSNEEKIITAKNDKEDDYNFIIYKYSITKSPFLFEEGFNLYKYKTINVVNSYQNKYKDFFSFNLNKSYKNRNNITPVELSSELNLSFESSYNKELILGNTINKEHSNLNNIIRIFDKYHKQTQLLNKNNYKNYKNKYKLGFNYINRINNYNYLKYKNISKFSKKEKKNNLKKNYSTMVDTHLKILSGYIKEVDKRKNKINEIKEKNESKEVQSKNIINSRRDVEFSTISNIKSNSKNIINNIAKEQQNKYKEYKIESNENDLIKTQNNMSLSLIKKISFENQDKTHDSIENNMDNRNSVNFTSKFEYKYKPINNKNRKTKSFFEETEKNNNQSINELNEIQDNINKKEKETKLENVGKRKYIFKKIQKNDSIKELKKIYTNLNSNIKQEKYLFNSNEYSLNNTILSKNDKNEKMNTNFDNNHNQPINNNKRKHNRFLNKNNKENSKSLLENNKNEEHSIQMNQGKSFINSRKNISQITNTDNNINDLSKINEQNIQSNKNNNIIKLNNNKNLINNRSFIFKSDKVNKNRIIFNNYNYKVVNSQKNIIPQKNVNQKEDKKDDTRADRLRARIKIIKRYKAEKNNVDNTYQSQEITNLSNINNNEGNPFKDKINYIQIKKFNRYGNHKYHEIKSTSCEKNIILNHKDKNHISYKIENKQPSQLIISTSMNNLKFFKNRINNEKSPDNKKIK